MKKYIPIIVIIVLFLLNVISGIYSHYQIEHLNSEKKVLQDSVVRKNDRLCKYYKTDPANYRTKAQADAEKH